MLAIVDNPGRASIWTCEKELVVCMWYFCVEWGCFVLSKLWKLGMKKKKKAYNHCQQIMSLSLCVEGAGVSAQATIYEYGA